MRRFGLGFGPDAQRRPLLPRIIGGGGLGGGGLGGSGSPGDQLFIASFHDNTFEYAPFHTTGAEGIFQLPTANIVYDNTGTGSTEGQHDLFVADEVKVILAANPNITLLFEAVFSSSSTIDFNQWTGTNGWDSEIQFNGNGVLQASAEDWNGSDSLSTPGGVNTPLLETASFRMMISFIDGQYGFAINGTAGSKIGTSDSPPFADGSPFFRFFNEHVRLSAFGGLVAIPFDQLPAATVY